MAVQYAFSQITTTGLKLAVDAADPLSYPGSGTTWTDVSGNGFTGTISSSISFATTNRGALVSSNSSSAVSFSGSAADFGQGSFTIEMTFLPSRISGTHWLYSKNSGSFPNFGAYITGSSGSGRIVAFYNISSTVSSSATTAVGSIVTGSNYVLDVTYAPSSIITAVYLNSNLITTSGANGTGSLSTSSSLLLLNNTTASNTGTMGNLYNFKVYNPNISPSNIRQNYNSMCSRFGLPLALYTPTVPSVLDFYPGAAAAYSLRKLTQNYLGFAIRVRRSSDNVEQDIGFVGNNLDTTSLLSFVGTGDGFVTTWYDQSGNGYNAIQTNAANQPQIVSVGSVLIQGSKSTLKFDGGDYLDLGTITYSNNCNTVVVTKGNNQLGGLIAVQGDVGGSNGMQLWDFNSKYTSFNSGISSQLQYTNNTDYVVLQQGRNTSTNSYLQVNGNLQTQIPALQDINPRSYYLGTITSSSFRYNGNIQEVIIYLNNQYTNLNGIETNINSYYSIY